MPSPKTNAPSVASAPAWLASAVFYQIYPQSFYDSNGDGIGDIPGIIKKLDYIARLGVTALWLNPCFVSPFQDAGYDVADYCRVAPRYGTNADLARLFRQAHRRGIRVCLDLVAGHTSIEHPWFKASCRHARNPFSDRYIWTPSTWDGGKPPLRFIGGFAERDGNYAINFFYSQPALNYGFARPDPSCPWQQPLDAPGPRATRHALRDIMRFWLDRGADGFRVDMAASLIKSDPDKKAVSALWRETRAWLERRYPEAVLIAEWGNPTQSLKAGFHVDFMIHFGVPGYPALFFNDQGVWARERCFFDRRGRGNICEFLDSYLAQYHATRRQGFISIPSGNHDIQRPNAGRSTRELKAIFAFILTWPGVPFIYYGDEIGMRFQRNVPSKEGGYGRTGARTPMQWDDSRNAGFSTAPARQTYLPVDRQKNRPSVAGQDPAPDSLLNHVRRLIQLRRSEPALQAEGDVIPLYAQAGRYPFVYLRRKGADRFVVAVNPAARPVSGTFRASGFSSLQTILAGGARLAVQNTQVHFDMHGVSWGVFKARA